MAISNEEYAARRDRLGAVLAARGLDALFVPPSSDLEYLTGIQRDLPSFGQISYAHGWVAGAFFAPGREPVYVLPRMVVDFHLDGVAPPGAQVVREDGDGRASFARRRPEPRLAPPDRARPACLGRDGDRAAAGGARRGALRRVVARERAAPRQVAERARADGAGVPDRAGGDGRGGAERRRRREHDEPGRGGRASAPRPRLALPLLPDPHLHLGRAPARLRWADGARPARGGRGRPLRLRCRRRRLLLRLRPHDSVRRAAGRVGGRAQASCSRPRRPAEPPRRPVCRPPR